MSRRIKLAPCYTESAPIIELFDEDGIRCGKIMAKGETLTFEGDAESSFVAFVEVMKHYFFGGQNEQR